MVYIKVCKSPDFSRWAETIDYETASSILLCCRVLLCGRCVLLPQQVVWLMFRLVVLTLIAATALCCVVGQSMILFLTSNGQEVATTGFYKFAAKTNWKLAFEFFVCFSEHCIGGRNQTNLVRFVRGFSNFQMFVSSTCPLICKS